MNIQLKIHVKNGSTQLIPVPMKKQVAVMVPQPKGEVSFELVDLETQLAPQRVFMKRVGNDLHIFIDEDTHVDVVIKDYYDNEPLSPIMGVAEDGMLYPYLAESNLLADSIPHLTENVLASQVLGGEGVVATLLPFNWTPFLYGLAGLAGAGLVASLFRGSDASGGAAADTIPVEIHRTLGEDGKPTGGLTIPTDPKANIYRIEFYPEGSKTPVTIVYERQPDGSFKLVSDTSKLNEQPPAVIAKGEPIVLPPNLLKDNAPVKVNAEGDNGAAGSATMVAPYDANTPLELDPVKGFDRDGDGTLDAAEISGKTSPGATVVITDKDGNKIAETTADDKGKFSVPVALDPKNQNSDSLDDLTVTATKPGENPASTPIPTDKYPTELIKPNNGVDKDKLPSEVDKTLQDSGKPTITEESLKAIDESRDSDLNPETLKLEGTAPANSNVTLYVVKDGKPIPVATVQATGNGSYKISASDFNKDFDMLTGDTIYVVAQEEGKNPTQSKEAQIPAVENGPAGHPYDTVRPEQPNVITKQAAGDGSAKVVADKLKPNETLHIKITDEKDKEHDLTFKLNDKGQLEQIVDPNNSTPDHIKFTIDGKTVTIEEDSLKDDHPVKAYVSDLAENHSPAADAITGFDQVTERQFDVELTAIDTDSPANTIADKVKVELTGNVKVGDTAIITDDKGNKLGEIKLEDKHKTDGGFIVEVPVNDNNKPPKTVSVAIQEEGSDPTAPVTKPLPPVAEGPAGHPNDKTDPTKPTLDQNEEGVTVNFNPENTDKLVVEQVGNPDSVPVVTYTKDPETGVFKSDNPAKYPDIPAGKDSVVIPRDQLPEEGKIKATASDLAGNNKPSDELDLLPMVEQLPPVQVDSVIAVDTSASADKNPEEFIITGKAEKGSTVIARDKKGNELGRTLEPVGEDGRFTITVRENPNLDLTRAPEIELVQDQTGKRESTPVNPPEASELRHTDNLPPAKPEPVNLGNNDVGLAIDPTSAKVNLEYTDKDGNKKTAELVRQPDGSLKSNDPNVIVESNKDAQGRDIVRIPSDKTTPNTIVSATAEDIVPNKSGKTDVPTRDNTVEVATNEGQPTEKTAVPELKTIVAKDTSNPADKKAELIKVSGTTEPNATVVVKLGNTVLGAVKANEKGEFSRDFSKPKGETFEVGDKITATATAPNKSESNPSNELAVPETTLFDDSVPPSAVTFGDNGDGKVEPNGDIKANLPTEDVQPGEKVVFTITPKDPNKAPTVVTLTKRNGNGWDSDNSDVIPSTDNNEVTIPDASTPDGATVTAVATDLAGNESTAEINAGNSASGKPSIDSIEAFDTSNPADRPAEGEKINPEMFKIKGKAPAGSKVIAKDEDGNVLGSTTAKDDGTFEIESAKESDKKDLRSGDPVYVEAIDGDKLPTASDHFPIPGVVAGKEGQIGDRTPPAPTNVTITPDGKGEIELPKQAQPGDKVKGEIEQPDGTKTPIEIVKGDDGNWTAPNNPNITIDNDNGKATIPSSDLPAGSKVTVHTEDPIGNASQDDEATVPDVTATPTIDSIKAIDTSDVADNDPEKVIVTGVVRSADGNSFEPEGTVVTLKTQDGKVIGSGVVEGDQGQFTVTGLEKNGIQLVVGGFVKVSAQAPNKSESPDSALKEIPAVAAGKDGHEDRTLPDSVTPTGEAKDKNITNDQDMTFDVPKTDVNTIELLVKPAKSADNDPPVKVTLTKNEDGSFTSDNSEIVPNVEAPTDGNAPKITIPAGSIKPNTVVEVTTVDLADNRGVPVEVSVTTPATPDAATNKVVKPALSTESDKTVKLVLPQGEDAAETLKVVLSYEDETTGNVVRVVFTRQANSDDWTISEKPDGFAVTVTDGTGTDTGKKVVILPENLVKDGTKVFAYGSNENGSIVSETVETTAAVKLVLTKTPTAVKVTPIDTSDEADNEPEKARFTGKVAGEPEGTLVEIKDASDNVIATTRTDAEGNFSVEVPTNKPVGNTTVGDLIKGNLNEDTLKVTATAPNKGISPLAATAQISKGELEHTDTTAPNPVQFDTAVNGDVIAKFPTDASEGDKAVFTLMPKGATDTANNKTATYTKQGDNWVKDNGSTVDGLPENIPVANGSLTIPAAQLQSVKNNDRTSVVEAHVQDIAGNKSVKTSQEVAFTNQPTIDSIDAIDTSYESDTNPEKFIIKGKVQGEDEGTIVTAKDQNGNVIGTGVVGANGAYEITAQETPDFDIVNGSNITVTANAKGKVESEKSDPKAVDTTNITHEESVPPTVDLTREGDVVTATVSGDTKEATVKVGDDVVTIKRDPETGNIKESSNPELVPTTTGGTKENPNTTFTIKAGDKPVTVTATDLAGNTGSATNEPTPVAPELPQTKTPDELVVKAIDTSNPADENPEKFVVSGKTSPNAKVEVKDITGKVIGTGKADAEGNFTVTAVQKENGHDVTVGENLTVKAEAPDHSPSEEANVAVTKVAEGPEGHEGDRTGPSVISIEREKPTEDGTGKKPDVIAKVDNDAKEVKVCVGDDCATLTRQDDGSFKSDKPELVPNTTAQDPNTIRVPGDVADGKTVTVTAIDDVGNEGEPAVLPPVFVPEKPGLDAKEDGSVEMTFPADAREGDKVVLTYQPNPTQAGGELPAREKITFTKQEDGTWKADKDVLPEPTTQDGVTTVTIPGDKVKDETPVSAYSENRENSGRSEPALAQSGIDGDGAKSGEELTTTTPSGLVLKALDTNGDGDPDQFTLEGEVTGEDDGTMVTVKFGDTVLAEVPVKVGKFTATFNDPAGANINVGSQLTVGAKAEGKKPSATVDKAVEAGDVTNVAPPVQPEQPKHTDTTEIPTDLKLKKVIDTSNPADGNPEKFVVEGRVPSEGEGVPVEIRDAKGNLIGEGTTVEGGKFEIVVTESNSHDLKLNKEPADSLSVTATAPNKNTSPAASLPLVEDAANPVEHEFSNDNQAPEVPTVTANPNDGSVKVKLPTDAVAGDKVTVSLTPTGKDASVDVVLTKNPDGSWTSTNPDLVPNAIDDQAFVTIPESAVRDDSEVSAKATDLAGNESDTSRDKAGNDRRTNTPVDLKAKAIDLDEKANGSAEKLVITGKVPDEQAGTKVFLFDAKGTQIAETTTGADGSFIFTVVKNNQPAEQHQGAVFVPAVNEDDSYRVQAKADDKLPSLNKPEVTVPAVPVFGQTNPDTNQPYSKDELAEFHPNDNTAPTAPTVTAGQPDKVKGDGSASIGLPADAVEGDKVIVTFTPEDKDGQAQPEQTLEVTKQPDGSWKITAPEEALKPAPSINGNVLTLPEDLLKDGSEVAAKSQDNMGKVTEGVPATTGKDEVATTPSAVKFTPIGEGAEADLDPEGVKITGKGKPGETIEVLDKDGSPINGADGNPIKHTIPEDAEVDENGLAEFTIDVKEPNPATIDEGTELKLKATHRDKEDSDTVSQTVPAMQPAEAKKDWDDQDIPNAGEGNHTGDSTNPNPPSLEANTDKGNGSVKLSKPAEPTQAGDRIEVKLIPETAANDESVIVTLTKQPDGSWESDNPLVPSIPAGEDSVDIPENSLKDGREVKARTVDVAGNVSPPIETATATAGNDDITKTPYDLVAKPFDTSSPADTQADAVLIQGKTDPNAVVTVMKGNTELFTVTADDKGEFSVLATNANAERVEDLKAKLAATGAKTETLPAGQSLNGADALTFKAKHPKKDESDTANATVGELTNGKDQHPFDETAPQAPRVTAIKTADITGKELGSVEITLPSTTANGEAPQNGDKVEIRYTKTNGEQATLVVTRENDAWKLPDNTPATEATIVDGDTVTLVAPAVKDGSTVYAQTIDVAGNPSALASAPAAFERTTPLEVTTVRAQKAAGSQSTDTDPEVLTVSGTTDAGAEVTVKLITDKDAYAVNDKTGFVELKTKADKNGDFSVTFEEGKAPLSKAPENGTALNEIVKGNNIIVTAELVGQKAPSAPDTQQVPSTRTMFIEAGDTDVVDRGTTTGDTYNASLSDNTIDEVTFTGKVEKGAKLKVQVLAANGDVIAEKEFDNADIDYDNEVLSTAQGAKLNSSNDPVDSGDFSVTLTKADLKQGKQFEKDQTVKITASHPTNTSIGENTVDGTALPALVDGTTDHPEDKQATALTDSAITFTHDTNGAVTAKVQLPSEADVKKATITFKGDDGQDKTVVLNKANGTWTLSTKGGENTAGLQANAISKEGDNTFLNIAGDKIKGTGADRGNLKVEVQDISHTTTSNSYEKAISEDQTTALTVNNPTGKDTSTRADSTAEEITITGTTTAGATVTLLDKDGNVVMNGNSPITATVTSTNFSLTFDVSKLPKGKRDGFKLKAKAPNHAETTSTAKDVPTVDGVDTKETVPTDKVHTGDNTAPALTGSVKGASAVFTMKKFDPNSNEAQLDHLAEGDVLTLVNKGSDGNGTTEIAKFKYQNGTWTKVSAVTGVDVTNIEELKEDTQDPNKVTGYALKVSSKDAAELNVGDQIEATIIDIAGKENTNTQTLPEPNLIDVAEIWAGARTKVNTNDAENADRLLLTGADAANYTNAGDIWVKVGADNNKVKINFVAENTQTDTQTGLPVTTSVWAIKQPNGEWKLYDEENPSESAVESTKGSVHSLAQNGSEANTNIAKYEVKTDGSGETFIRLNAEEIKDKSNVTVVSYDEDGNSTESEDSIPTKNGQKIVAPLSESASNEQQEAYKEQLAAAKVVSIETDFDDPSEDTVTLLKATQANANSDIVVDTPSNSDFAGEVTAYVVQFDTDTNLSKDEREYYGLADPNQADQHNYLVALKVPNKENGGTTWALGLWSGSANSVEDVNLSNTVDVSSKVATIDPATGKITLNKTVVKNNSKVIVGTVDAYGNESSPQANDNENILTTQHTNDPNSHIAVEKPDVSPQGFGKILVTPGRITEKLAANGTDYELDGSNFKTKVDIGNDNSDELVIEYDAATYKYKLKDSSNNTDVDIATYNNGGVSVHSFNPETGELVLKGPNAKEVKAVAYKTVNGTEHSSDSVVKAIVDVDIRPDSVDQAFVHPQSNGDIVFVPGEDNDKLKVEYFTQGGGGAKATVILVKNGDTWSVDPNSPHGKNGEFNGLTLGGDYVEDFTHVTVTGIDSSSGEDKEAAPHSALALVADGNGTDADAPEIMALGTDPSNNPDHHNPKVVKGNDNVKVEVQFTPAGAANNDVKETIIAQLEEGGKWTLKYPDGSFVPETLATLDPDNNIILKHTALSPKSTVTAVGYDNDGHDEPSNTYTLPNGAGASGPVENNPTPNREQTSGHHKITVHDDSSFSVTTHADATWIRVPFYVHEMATGAIKQLVFYFGRDSGAKVIDGMNPNTATEIPMEEVGATFDRNTNYKMTINSNYTNAQGVNTVLYRLVTDSPSDNKLTTEHLKVEAFGYHRNSVGTDDSTTKAVGNLKNDNAYSGPTTLPVAEAIERLEKIETGGNEGNQGGMIIHPHTDNTILSVTYIRESGEKATALLVKENGNWKVKDGFGNPNDFIFQNGQSPQIHYNALLDNTPEGVTVKGGKAGHLYSEAKTETTAEDAPRPKPTADDINNDFNDTALNNGNPIKLSNDIEVRHGNLIRSWIKKANGITELENSLNNSGKGSVKIGDASDPKVEITLDQNTAHQILVDGSLGDTLAQNWGRPKGRIFDMHLTTGNKNDILALQNDLGENEREDQRTYVNMNDGHDVISVGGATRDFVLYEDPTKFDASERYYYSAPSQPKKQGDQPIGVLENASLASSVGGRIHYSIIDMGEGNDSIFVEGFRSGDPFAIDRSRIDLGSGHDILLVAPNGEDSRTFSDRGTIGNSVIIGGSGDDFVKAVGLDEGAQVLMGDDNDTLEVTRIEKAPTLVDMGNGNDIVRVTGEVRGGAKIFLGNGDDIFEFGGSPHVLFGSSGKHALFEGYLDGGSGYDVVKLKTPARTSLINRDETNLSSKNFKNIEEIWLADQTSVDLRYDDLLKDGVNGPIKIRKDGQSVSALVDLGGNNLNGEGLDPNFSTSVDSSAGGSWRKVTTQTVEEAGVNYHIYQFGNDTTNTVWIENGIAII